MKEEGRGGDLNPNSKTDDLNRVGVLKSLFEDNSFIIHQNLYPVWGTGDGITQAI
jgi:hypothetical protein